MCYHELFEMKKCPPVVWVLPDLHGRAPELLGLGTRAFLALPVSHCIRDVDRLFHAVLEDEHFDLNTLGRTLGVSEIGVYDVQFLQ